LFVLFFFQAEDGIQFFHVTGVQTCALPIPTLGRGGEPTAGRRTVGSPPRPSVGSAFGSFLSSRSTSAISLSQSRSFSIPATTPRSEERRVGTVYKSLMLQCS